MVETFKFIGQDTVLALGRGATITIKHGQIMALHVKSEVSWHDRHVRKWRVQIIAPFFCPYSSWAAFYQNWKLLDEVIEGEQPKQAGKFAAGDAVEFASGRSIKEGVVFGSGSMQTIIGPMVYKIKVGKEVHTVAVSDIQHKGVKK